MPSFHIPFNFSVYEPPPKGHPLLSMHLLSLSKDDDALSLTWSISNRIHRSLVIFPSPIRMWYLKRAAKMHSSMLNCNFYLPDAVVSEKRRGHFLIPIAKTSFYFLSSSICLASLASGPSVPPCLGYGQGQTRESGGVGLAYKSSLLSLISYLGYFSVTEATWSHFDETSLCQDHPFCS